jgi:DNA polymerase
MLHRLSVRTFEEWRAAVRPLLASGMRVEDIEWLAAASVSADVQPSLAEPKRIGRPQSPQHQQSDAFSSIGPSSQPASAQADGGSSAPDIRELRLSRSLINLLECVAHYRHPGRWELMYRLAWRTLNENPRLLEDEADRDVRNATLMERAVDRECHKMHAFVRFRETKTESGSLRYFAWFEPEHEILRRGVKFFTKRFPNMDWTIATPDGAAVWEERSLRFIDAPGHDARPREDSHEALWRTYYRSICNVARINPTVMQREMPQRYWRHLPEAAEIPVLIRDGVEKFAQRHSEVDDTALRMAKAIQRSLAQIPSPGEGPAVCRRCDLWRHATQAVNGEGPEHAAIMLVGEQPGDEEDLRGRAFVGPAGKVLDQAIDSAGLTRADLFVTNAVKHFKWEPRGKRRLHRRPDVTEINACHVWLDREIASVRPRIIVALGATALRALTGRSDSIESARQQNLRHQHGASIVCTYHPSAILRADAGGADTLRMRLVEDLRRASELLRS